jgi:NAD(P)H-dependent FMN reductase
MYNPDTTESDDGDDDDDDDKITKIRDVLNWPDAFLAGSPDYHGSIWCIEKFFRLLLQRIC